MINAVWKNLNWSLCGIAKMHKLGRRGGSSIINCFKVICSYWDPPNYVSEEANYKEPWLTCYQPKNWHFYMLRTWGFNLGSVHHVKQRPYAKGGPVYEQSSPASCPPSMLILHPWALLPLPLGSPLWSKAGWCAPPHCSRSSCASLDHHT